MKTRIGRNGVFQKSAVLAARALVVAGFLFGAASAYGQPLPPSGGGTNTNLLASWSFENTTNWDTDQGYAPVSFTNLNSFELGEGNAMVLDTNVPAWLQYYVYEPGNAATNLAVSSGSVTLWFAPDWASTSQGGTGPGEAGRLFEVGSYTPASSYGWWSLYVDALGNNLYFSTQTNNLSGNFCTFLTFPISWTSNYFHFVALNYSATNTALYLDGVLATNGSPLTVYPGTNVLAGGLFVGSDSNGVLQAHGMIAGVAACNCQLSAAAINAAFTLDEVFYLLKEPPIPQAPSQPENTPTFQAITGPGYLLALRTNTAGCLNSSSVSITNLSAAATNRTVDVTFTIAGGSNGLPYDVFATPELTQPITNGVWTWMGQGYQCVTYSLPGLTNGTVFLLLGTPQDSDGDGLTDAYELLVSHTNPYVSDTSGDGMLDGWKVLWGLNPLINNPDQTSERANYTYDGTGRIQSVSGVLAESFGFDPEGNIQLDQP